MKLLNSEKLNMKIPKYEKVINAFIPSKIYIPLYDSSLGIKIGGKIKEGDVVSSYLGVNIHSSIPGKLCEVKNVTMPSGKNEKVAVVNMQGAFSFEGKKTIKSEWILFQSTQILNLLEQNGVHNTFFDYEKISYQKNDENSSVILGVRLFDYDPSCVTDSFLFENFYEKIFEGAFIVGKAIGAEKVDFFFSKEQKNIVEKLKNHQDYQEFNYDFVLATQKKYSFGTKEELNHLLQKKNEKVSYFIDSTTCLGAFEAVALCKPVMDTFVQVSGSLLGEEKFFKVKKGTLIKNLIEECGLCKSEPYKVVINGLLRGVSISTSDTPITDYVKSITVLSAKETAEQKQRACIRCGDCFRVCPVEIKPEKIFSMYHYNTDISPEIKKMAEKCTQCGRCNTVCPSRIPLFQTISLLTRNEK